VLNVAFIRDKRYPYLIKPSSILIIELHMYVLSLVDWRADPYSLKKTDKALPFFNADPEVKKFSVFQWQKS